MIAGDPYEVGELEREVAWLRQALLHADAARAENASRRVRGLDRPEPTEGTPIAPILPSLASRIYYAGTDALFIFVIVVGLFMLLPYASNEDAESGLAVSDPLPAAPTATAQTTATPTAAIPTAAIPTARTPTANTPTATAAVAAVRVEDSVASEQTVRPPARDSRKDEIVQQIQTWRSAWALRQVEDYLAAYSSDFRPADGTARERWVRQRRHRVDGRTPLSIVISDLEVRFPDETTAEATFRQDYASRTYRDRVEKTLVLVHAEDGWRIVEERVAP